MGKVFLPSDIEEAEVPLIFLAGPIRGTEDWQATAIEYIQKLNSDVNIASPRRSFFDEENNYEKEKQVDWETDLLRQAAKKGVILFWLAKETEHNTERAYAQTSRFELAEWKLHHERDGVKLTIGIENGFTGARYIRRRFAQDCPDVQILDSLESVCKMAIELLK